MKHLITLIISLALLAAILALTTLAQEHKPLEECLPEEITPSTTVDGQATVEDRLAQADATCTDELRTGTGEPIRFYERKYCGGANPGHQREQQQQETITQLRENNHLILIECPAPSGALAP